MAAVSHTVTLPHPDRGEPTVGRCTCGWTVLYGWGEHGQAVDAGADHIRAEARAEPVETATLAGERRLYEGTSL